MLIWFLVAWSTICAIISITYIYLYNLPTFSVYLFATILSALIWILYYIVCIIMFIRCLPYQTYSLSYYILLYTLTQCHRLDYCKPLCAFWRPLKTGASWPQVCLGRLAIKWPELMAKWRQPVFFVLFSFLSLPLSLYAFCACCAHTHIEKLFSHWRPQRAQKTMQPKIAFPTFPRLGLRAPFVCVCVFVFSVCDTCANFAPKCHLLCYFRSTATEQKWQAGNMSSE